tara:strand:+ start:628 stop:1545 length:918 start_codon:yes stop_codon:yes gene_type:complete
MSVRAYVPCVNATSGKKEQHAVSIVNGRLRTECSSHGCRSLLEDWRMIIGQISNPNLVSADPEEAQTRYPKKLRPAFLEACRKARSRRDYKREAIERLAVLSPREGSVMERVGGTKHVLPMGMLTRGNGFLPRGFVDPGNCNVNEWRVFVREHLPDYHISTRGNRAFPPALPEMLEADRKSKSTQYRYWRKYPRLFRSWEKMAKLEKLLGQEVPQECIDQILPDVEGYEVPDLGKVGIEIKKIYSGTHSLGKPPGDVLVYFEKGFIGRKTCMVRFTRWRGVTQTVLSDPDLKITGDLRVEILDEV